MLIDYQARWHRITDRIGNSSLLTYLAFAFGIALLLSLHYLIKGRAFAFVDIGIDTFSYYYPIQIIQAQQLRELHALTWSFQLGLGGYIGSVFNPTQLVTAWVPDDWQLAVRLPTFFGKMILAGGFFYGFLRRIRFEPPLAAIGALAFAYSSYAMINGQWDTQGLVILQLAAYLFFFESFFRRGNLWYAVAAGLTVGMGSAFNTYTFSLLSLLYLLIRPVFTSRGDDHTAFLVALLRFGCFAALGFALMLVVQLPNLLYLLDSPRVSGEHAKFTSLLDQLSGFNNTEIIGAEVVGMYGKDLLGTGNGYQGWSNYFEAPAFYVGMLMMVCAPQLLGPTAMRRERWLFIAGSVLLAAYMVWPPMRYVVYGFGHTGFRLSTLWVSTGLLVLGLAGLRRVTRSGVWRLGLIASALGIVGILLLVAWHYQEIVSTRHVALVIAFAIVYCVALWPTGTNRNTCVSMGLLTCIFACELLLFSIPPLMQRTTVRAEDAASRVGSYEDGTRAALALVHSVDDSQEFYRIEKTYRSLYLNDALVQGYNGTKSYFFHGKSITRFVNRMELPRPFPRTNYIGSMAERPDILNLLGVKYLLSRSRKPDKNPRLEYVGHAGKIHVYRNTTAHGIGHLYHQVVGEDATSKLPVAERDALLLDHVVVESPEAIRSRLAALGRSHGDSMPAGQTRSSLRKLSDIHLEADVVAAQAGVYLIAMPFDVGWDVTVDGIPAELFRVDYGLTGLLLAPGRHRITLRYSVPGRAIGMWASLAALLILLVVGIYQLISAKRRRTVAETS